MNASTHFLSLKTPAGVALNLIDDYHGLTYRSVVNGVGVATFRLRADNAAVANIADKCQLLIYRQNKAMGVTQYVDWGGLIRKMEGSTTDHDMVEVTVLSWNHFLHWRVVDYYAGYANRSQFTAAKAETVMKTIVDYNCCNNATVAHGRHHEGAITGLTIEADGAHGNTIDWACHEDNVLTTLQNIAQIGGGDFAVVKTGAVLRQFKWYTGQLGTDRSATVKFSLANGNMGNPVYTFDRSEEVTAAIVGGQGEESARAYVVRTGANYNVITNNVEGFVDASRFSTTAGYESAGDKALGEWQARQEFTFDVLQTPSCFYGLHYFLGDKCLAEYGGTTATVKVAAVNIQVADGGGETVGIETENV